jgi:transposase
MGSKKRKYTTEFKEEAVKLVTTQGYTQIEAAESLGVNSKNISRWISELNGMVTGKKSMLTVEQEELQYLRKENKRLRLEREILKKAAAFFASEPV